MSSRRPCRICHRWFFPDRKVGDRQHVCGDPACQKEAHRRSCARLRRGKAEGQKRTRFAKRLLKLASADCAIWPGAREGERLKFTIFLAEMVQQLLRRRRETSAAHLAENKRVKTKVEPPGRARNKCGPSVCKQKAYANSSLSGGARRDGGGDPAAQPSS